MYEAWIRKHLPKDLPSDVIAGNLHLSGYYVKDKYVFREGERGSDTIEYAARSDEDLQLWLFKNVALSIASDMELRLRSGNALKWRYIRDHAENGRYLYIERSKYQYNAIEDTRLAMFETYLRLVKAVMTPDQWNEEVCEHIRLMNLHFRQPHWDYDKADMQFIEISDSKSVSEGIEEPAPGTIIKKN